MTDVQKPRSGHELSPLMAGIVPQSLKLLYLQIPQPLPWHSEIQKVSFRMLFRRSFNNPLQQKHRSIVPNNKTKALQKLGTHASRPAIEQNLFKVGSPPRPLFGSSIPLRWKGRFPVSKSVRYLLQVLQASSAWDWRLDTASTKMRSRLYFALFWPLKKPTVQHRFAWFEIGEVLQLRRDSLGLEEPGHLKIRTYICGSWRTIAPGTIRRGKALKFNSNSKALLFLEFLAPLALLAFDHTPTLPPRAGGPPWQRQHTTAHSLPLPALYAWDLGLGTCFAQCHPPPKNQWPERLEIKAEDGRCLQK